MGNLPPANNPNLPDQPASAAGARTTVAPASRQVASVTRLLREVLETVVLAVLVFLVVHAVWRNFWVEGSSMEPGIHNGQSMIVERLVYSNGFPGNLLHNTIGRMAAGKKLVDGIFHAPRRGDVIVLIPPSSPSKDYIKRVIGIPGDKIEIKQGKLYINDHLMVEPYISPGGPSAYGPVRVGQDELFVMGDNRGASTDSRFFGMLPVKNVVGKAWFSYWPPTALGPVKHYDLSAQLQAAK